MMRLRRNLFLPPFGDIRKTRGMGNVSMLRLRRANSIAALMRLKRMTQMRLKRMTQMRLKRMTQMRLKKSGLADLAYTDDNELPSIVSDIIVINYIYIYILRLCVNSGYIAISLFALNFCLG